MSLFGKTVSFIIAKLRHSDVFNICVSEKNVSVLSHPCTDRYTEANAQTLTGVVYSVVFYTCSFH